MGKSKGFLKIYFAGSICGGRDDQPLYVRIIEHLKTYGTVLTEQIGRPDLTAAGFPFLVPGIPQIVSHPLTHVVKDEAKDSVFLCKITCLDHPSSPSIGMHFAFLISFQSNRERAIEISCSLTQIVQKAASCGHEWQDRLKRICGVFVSFNVK